MLLVLNQDFRIRSEVLSFRQFHGRHFSCCLPTHALNVIHKSEYFGSQLVSASEGFVVVSERTHRNLLINGFTLYFFLGLIVNTDMCHDRRFLSDTRIPPISTRKASILRRLMMNYYYLNQWIFFQGLRSWSAAPCRQCTRSQVQYGASCHSKDDLH